VLLLDEPTVGLDPQVRRRLWDLIRRLNAQGLTMLLTTHYIEEAEQLCHRVGILNRGRLIALGTPAELKAQLASKPAIRARSLEDVFVELTGDKVGE
jgi:ABC-2 type transport system ATP-binding protein